jgi:DeoR family transcriptional regulator, glycerol-3-phosphate regulon repressor
MDHEISENDASGDGSPDALNERRSSLLGIVQGQGFATVEALAERFGVSTQTIRRDIIWLDERGLLQRFHGGAGALDATVRLGYAQKQTVSVEAKSAIGRAAAALVPENATIFLDVGTTVEAAARALAERRSLRVFTNSLPSALHLAGRPGIEVTVTGGTLRGADGSLVGEGATALLRDLRLDLALIGLSGWDEDGAPMDFDLDKIAVKRLAIARSRRTIALCDASKFERMATARIAPLDAFACLACDRVPSGALRAALERHGVEIVPA